jgi:hypothetical protein
VREREGSLESSEVPVSISFSFLFWYLLVDGTRCLEAVIWTFPIPFFSVHPFHRFLSALFLVYRSLRRSRFQDSKLCLRFRFFLLVSRFRVSQCSGSDSSLSIFDSGLSPRRFFCSRHGFREIRHKTSISIVHFLLGIV